MATSPIIQKMIVRKIMGGASRCNHCRITKWDAKKKGIDLYVIIPRMIETIRLTRNHIVLCEDCLLILKKMLERYDKVEYV